MLRDKRKYIFVIILVLMIVFVGIIIVNIHLNKSVGCFNSNYTSEREKNNFKIYVIKGSNEVKLEFLEHCIQINKSKINALKYNLNKKLIHILKLVNNKYHYLLDSISINWTKLLTRLENIVI
ncbi:hypothetical protein CLTEP_15650 [Clostridium tepidiprofundi DSM 19306]|uniref:Uncharacterized protein n=1 Tax=Clostridium tepidiprofundi DSM 19306 TaxID=1121338 RepID=A0A151B3P7_9CLOT|nr:hypothetical protein [Clostridium tepidiprofundi]KYH34516.1 hypothetical protein CLTEP_15650 [Clostridium tepidiprofundi DSM 19306]